MPNGRSGERTRTHYKHRFFERVMASAPGAILEVGCGRGAFLKEATRRGCRVIGLEADNELVMELQEAGIGAQLGRAEELPFKNASFDVVVFQYVLHHCENLAQALGEAVRVARRGVFVSGGLVRSGDPVSTRSAKLRPVVKNNRPSDWNREQRIPECERSASQHPRCKAVLNRIHISTAPAAYTNGHSSQSRRSTTCEDRR
jgi:ubiquinone/menaquinone biosynthesis C-methylase UbiE